MELDDSLASLAASSRLGEEAMDSFQTFLGLRSLQDQVNVSAVIEDMSTIGCPIVFASGQFTSSTIRMELNELQKADLGRK
jgi:hypothetical protein